MPQPIPAGHPGERVALLRGRLGLRQIDLAQTASLSVDTIQRLEQGKLVPSYQSLTRIATALHTTVAHLTTPIE